MMLSGSFYTVKNLQQSAGLITADINFNAHHPIFKGHFPTIPVVPGVCMMQLVKETLEQATGIKTRISKASQLKFLSLITPANTPMVMLKLTYSNSGIDYEIQGELLTTDRIFFKMKATLSPQ